MTLDENNGCILKEARFDPMPRLYQSRKCRSVGRFAGQQFLDPPNIAEHQYATASLFLWLSNMWRIPVSTTAIEFVLNHDLMETETGDLLFPVKHRGENDKLWDQIEKSITELSPFMEHYTDKNCALTDAERWLFRYCDALEGLITALEETKRNKLRPPAECVRVYQKVLDQIIEESTNSRARASAFFDRVVEVFG